MNYKITRQLLSYFLIILIAFSVILTAVLLTSGRNLLRRQYLLDAEVRVNKVARTLSDNYELLNVENNQIQINMQRNPGMMDGRNNIFNQHMKGGQRYMRIINDILNRNVLIYDRNGDDPIGLNVLEAPFDLKTPVIRDLINSAFSNKTKVSLLDDNNFNNQIIVAAAPVYSADGQVSNAVLIFDEPAKQMPLYKAAAKLLLLVILVSMAVTALISYFFAQRYARPLIDMNNMTLSMMEGDYTKRLNIERDDELGTLSANIDNFAERLEISRRKLEGLEQIRKDFISSISHELKTPVSVLKGSLESLRDGMIPQENVPALYNTLNDEIVTLERLIADLMELTSLSNPNFPIQKEEVFISEILNDSIRSMRSIAAKKNITLKTEMTDKPCPMSGDYTRLKQLFRILIDNAIKYSEEGSEVEVIYKEPMEVSVRNRGKEITPSQLDSIFKPFYKIDLSSSGKGLGLSIAKEIATRHNLDIKVNSENGFNTFKVIKTDIIES